MQKENRRKWLEVKNIAPPPPTKFNEKMNLKVEQRSLLRPWAPARHPFSQSAVERALESSSDPLEPGLWSPQAWVPPRLCLPSRGGLALAAVRVQGVGCAVQFLDKQKLREFCTTKPALQQILKDIL